MFKNRFIRNRGHGANEIAIFEALGYTRLEMRRNPSAFKLKRPSPPEQSEPKKPYPLKPDHEIYERQSEDLSHHHIITRPHLIFVFEHFTAKDSVNSRKFVSLIYRLIFPIEVFIPITLEAVTSYFVATLKPYFVWMPCNLIEGPHVKWRMDDPRDKFERIRPLYFDETLWQCLLDLGENILFLQKEPCLNHEKWVLNALIKLADAWEKMEMKRIHPFSSKEWQVVIDPKGSPRCRIYDDPFPPLPSRPSLAKPRH